MKNFYQYIQYKPVLLTITLLASIQISFGQAVSPTSNKPDNSSLPAQSVIYPRIHNLNNTGKFNYVRTTIPDQPVQNMNGSFFRRQSTDYFDGLGRPLQTVIKRGHADGNDIVNLHVYDSLGREQYQYLPYAAPTGGIYVSSLGPGQIKVNDSTQLRGFYDNLGPDEQPFSRTIFESSPLNRVIKQMAPGRSWVGATGAGRGITFDYKTNGLWQYNWVSLRNIGNAYPRYTIGPNNTDIPVYAGSYGMGELFITISTDEDGKTSWELKDKRGLIVTKMQLVNNVTTNFHPTDYAYTFYVYDDLGRLRCVIPPEAIKPHKNADNWSIYWDTPSPEKVYGLCHTFSYDSRSRIIEKKVPGKAVEYFLYDKRDREIFYQDGNLRNEHKWAFTFYDALDRQTATGITSIDDGYYNLSELQTLINSGTTNGISYYVNNYDLYHEYPTSGNYIKVMSYTYYDDYDQVDLSSYSYDNSQFFGVEIPNNNTVISPSANASKIPLGLPTGCKVRVIDPDDPDGDNWLTSVNYYDDKGRVIQTQSKNVKGYTDISSNIYYFQGMLYKNILKHENQDAVAIDGSDDEPITQFKLINTLERNLGLTGGNDKVWLHKQKINGGIDYYLSAYDYDHMGRVVLKQFTAGANFQDYNMRGFVNDIIFNSFNSDTLFQEKLFYDKGFASKLYNGNIAGVIWAGVDQQKKAYGYTYDMLNRLTHAEFSNWMPGGTGGISTPHWDKTTMDYTASNLSYDQNGNIMTMDQNVKVPGPGSPASTQMDQLTYSYAANSNKLLKVEDGIPAATTAAYGLPDFKNGANDIEEYTYDSCGNMTTDKNKKISSISYNYLDKPERITVDGGEITYVYDGAGNCLQKRVTTNAPSGGSGSSGGSPPLPTVENWDYIGNFVYKDNQLQYILNEEGRARPIAASGNLVPTGSLTQNPVIFVYDYFVKDHLGNVRSTITSTPASQDYAARHEIASANVEELVFDNIPLVRELRPGSISPDDRYAARLNGGEKDKSVGTAIMLRVNAKDRLHFSVKAFYDGEYVQKDDIGTSALVESLMSTLLHGQDYSGVPLSEMPENAQIVQNIFSNSELASQINDVMNNSNDPNAPNAHLNYLWFNDDLQLQGGFSGSIQVPQNVNGIGTWTTLGNGGQVPATGNGGGTMVTPWDGGDFEAPSSGILVVYIDNQSIGQDVWFDDLFVTNYNSAVVEEDHYYPYGLCLNTTPILSGVNKQPFKLTTKELITDFDLNINDFSNRMYDPTSAHWWQSDPMAGKFFNKSPYNYCNNNPVLFVDPDGEFSLSISGDFLRKHKIKDIKGFAEYMMREMEMLEEFSKKDQNKDVMMALSKETGIKRDQVKEDFICGFGPTIILTTEEDEHQDPNKKTITISGNHFVTQYKASISGDKEEEYYQRVANQLYIMHEYTHYGDKLTNHGSVSGQLAIDNPGTGLPESTDPSCWQMSKSISGHRGSDIDNMNLHGYFVPITDYNAQIQYWRDYTPNSKIHYTTKTFIDKSKRFGPYKKGN